MANLKISLPLLVLVVLHNAAPTHSATATSFIESSCRVTRYPALCVHSLSAYATSIRQSGRQLTQTALSVSLNKSRLAAAFVSNLAKGPAVRGLEYQALKDCIENMGDTVDRLRQSVKELRDLRRTAGGDLLWHLSNVQTWVSAALTDETTCLDGFASRRLDGQVKAAIRRKITLVAQVTSNALALVNHFADKKH
ncbi:pectinesterase inhibitor 9-like [Cucurbita pepo subsp. pepo]|uniref:pectinesterase inhibitor 9-like n=1 Tax=Cucurbita pepo subsp. pepo TaxID=3664 RepID=UPI000C9DA61E|nr:pectinesterase inhibitor 9-like [Cucurbita pepo subsp. pepo]